MNYSSFNKHFFVVGLFGFLISKSAVAGHAVSIIRAEPESKPVHLTLIADVSNSANHKSTALTGRNYRLSVQIPKDTALNLSLGSSVTVTLPTIHRRNTLAKITSISKTKIELLLANQVQILEGQRLTVTLPIKPVHLYRIPFQAIYSPRGLTTEVFVLSNDRRVRLVQVAPLQFLADGKIIVSSDQLNGALIVVQGTDNLIAGDQVQVIEPVKQKEPQL